MQAAAGSPVSWVDASLEWPCQAGWAAIAVDAEFLAGEGLHFEAGLAQAGVGFGVLFYRDQTVVPWREDVAGERFALGVVDFDEAEIPGTQELYRLNGEPGEIDEDGLAVEHAHE